MNNNNLRFISQEQFNLGIEYFHLARVALSDKPFKEQSKYNRILWACRELHKKYSEISKTAFYKDIETNLQGY